MHYYLGVKTSSSGIHFEAQLENFEEVVRMKEEDVAWIVAIDQSTITNEIVHRLALR